jgi:hypothetical protein
VYAVFYPIQKKERDKFKYTNVDGIYNRGVFFKMMGGRARAASRKKRKVRGR